jgi:hypothetical protein
MPTHWFWQRTLHARDTRVLRPHRRHFTAHLLMTAASLLSCAGCLQTTLPGRSFGGKAAQLTDGETELCERLRAHVNALADHIGERNVERYDALCRAAEYIAARFRDAGCDVTFQEYVERGRAVRNVVAELRGSERPSEILIFGAHYDTVPGSPGADDNASGVAAVIELARALHNGPPLRRTVRFVAFVTRRSRSSGRSGWAAGCTRRSAGG